MHYLNKHRCLLYGIIILDCHQGQLLYNYRIYAKLTNFCKLVFMMIMVTITIYNSTCEQLSLCYMLKHFPQIRSHNYAETHSDDREGLVIACRTCRYTHACIVLVLFNKCSNQYVRSLLFTLAFCPDNEETVCERPTA